MSSLHVISESKIRPTVAEIPDFSVTAGGKADRRRPVYRDSSLALFAAAGNIGPND